MGSIHGRLKKRLLPLGAALALLVATAAPAGAAWGEFEEPITGLFADITNERSVFVNITARDFCDWAATDFDGPPPVQQLIDAQLQESADGALVGEFRGRNVHIELWEFDDRVDPNDPTTLIGPCEDIQDQLDDPEAEPWASGLLTRFTGRDNDLAGTGSRLNDFGDQGDGIVMDGDGTNYAYSWKFDVAINPDGELLNLREINELSIIE